MIEDIFYDLEFIQITSNDKSYYFIYKDMIYRIIADDDNASHFVMYYYSTPQSHDDYYFFNNLVELFNR